MNDMDARKRIEDIECELTAHGLLFEYIVAPLIATHPHRDEFFETMDEVRRQAETSSKPATHKLGILIRRLREQVQAHIDAGAGPG